MKKTYNELLKQDVWETDNNKTFRRKSDGAIVGTMLVRFAPSDSIDNYEEVDIQEEVNE